MHRTGYSGNGQLDGSARPLCHMLTRISGTFLEDSSAGLSRFLDEVGSHLGCGEFRLVWRGVGMGVTWMAMHSTHAMSDVFHHPSRS